MISDKIELILIFVAVITGVVSAAYFYQSTGIFVSLLQRPLRLISSGMMVIAIAILIAAVISYLSKQGLIVFVDGLPLQAFFYILYIIGSLLIFFGAKKFAKKPVVA